MARENIKAAVIKYVEGLEKGQIEPVVSFQAEGKLEEGLRCRAKVRDFKEMIVDEPANIGGSDQAPTPAEYVLVALGACQEIMYSAYAAAMGIKLDELKVNCKGNINFKGLFGMDDAVVAGFSDITYETQIKSSASPEQISKLIETAERYCPILDTITREVKVSGKAYLNGNQLHSFNSEKVASFAAN